jgi:hypothetical protein
MSKVEKSMTKSFRRIHKEHEKNNIDVMKMIRTLGNTMVNLQQMSTHQAVHIVISLPLNSSSRACIFINTTPIDQRTFVLKLVFLLKQELNDSKDVMYHSIIDYYIERPPAIKNICLAKFVSMCRKDGTHV